MALVSASFLRRLVTRGVSALTSMVILGSVAAAQQQLVTTGSIIPLQHSQFCQIYDVKLAPNGDTLFLDVCGGGGYGSVYQLKKGSTTFQTITSVIDSGGTYFNESMAIDAKGTFYITDRYSSSQHIYRTPYNPADGTWDFSAAGNNWEPQLDTGFESNGTQNVAFYDNPARDGSGILFVSSQSGNNIMAIPVNADGTVPTFTGGTNAGKPQFQYIVRGLTDKVQPMVTDVNGNLYFIENPYDPPTDRSTGVYFVPATAYKSCMAKSASGGSDPTVACISGAESSLQRVDSGNPEKFNGITLDAAGNVYVSDASDNYGGTRNGLLKIPNESGSPVGVTAQSFNFEDAEYIAPVSVNANPTIDPRGFIWLTTGTSSNYSPGGSGAIPGTGNLVLWQLGSENLGATPVGTPSATGVAFYMFSGSVTPAAFGASQPGGTAQFTTTAVNPYPPTNGTTPAIPCTPGMAYIAFSSCQVWTTLTPAGPNSVGSIQGQLTLLDSKNNVVPGSALYLDGIGQGPAASLLTPSQQTPLSTALVTPQQVAGDSIGNSYVADAGQGKVLMFAAGSAMASAGTPVGTGLTAPTGVAVDGSGDLFIADSGKVLEVPAVNGTLNPAGQAVLQSGLGTNLRLAVDGADNIYVADPDNARIVRIYNRQTATIIEGTATVGAGFTKPTAVAVDNTGNVFVADGASLIEITPFGLQTTITNNLAAPVTGLAVDPSGSVDVAQGTGVLRIPLEATGLNFNDAAAIDNGGVTATNGIGLDGLGNLYVTTGSYTVNGVAATGPTTTTVTSPTLLLLAGASVSFGNVSTQTESDPQDVSLFNIGNLPLALTGNPSFSGANATDYAIEQDGLNPCDPTGATAVASGTACTLGVTVNAQNTGVSQASMTVTTNAINAPTTTATLDAFSEDNLCRTQTTITVTPSTGIVFPGSAMVAATTAATDPTCSPGNTPTGGKITLTLAPQAKGSSQTKQTGTLSGGQASFNLTALNGGNYILFVSYSGDSIFGGSSSSRTFTVVVGQATPNVTLGSPTGIAAINGVYYVKQGATTTLNASVTSSVGTPTGSISFLSGSTVADPTQDPIQLDANGNGTFNTSNLPVGNYNLVANFNGDLNFGQIASPTVTVDIINPSALITTNPASLTTQAGVPVTGTLTITALEGYAPALGAQLMCDNTTLPKYAECTFDVPKIDIFDNPGIPQISHITISSNIPVNEGALRREPSSIAFAGMFGLGVLGFAFRRRAQLHHSALKVACLILICGGMLGGFTGCTNSGYTSTPVVQHVVSPSGTYNVRIYTVDLTTNQVSSLPFTLPVTIQ